MCAIQVRWVTGKRNNSSLLNSGSTQRNCACHRNWWFILKLQTHPLLQVFFKNCTIFILRTIVILKKKSFFSYSQLASLLTRWNEQTHFFPNLKFCLRDIYETSLKISFPTFMLTTISNTTHILCKLAVITVSSSIHLWR